MAIVYVPLNSRKYPGRFAIIDEEDYERVFSLSWGVHIKKHTTYAIHRYTDESGRGRQIYMHRFVLDISDDVQVDHWDGDGLHNVRSNLRPCTNAQNAWNRIHRPNTARYRGAYYHKGESCWRAMITCQGKTSQIGRFKTAKDAARAYDKKARELFGEFARLNFPDAYWRACA